MRIKNTSEKVIGQNQIFRTASQIKDLSALKCWWCSHPYERHFAFGEWWCPRCKEYRWTDMEQAKEIQKERTDDDTDPAFMMRFARKKS